MRFTLPQVSHITRRGGVYYYRRRFPGRLSGEVALSLHTRHFREAEHRADLLDRAFGKAWERAVADEAAGGTLGTILRDYLRAALDRDLERRFERQPGEAVYAQWWEPGDAQSAAEADLQVIRERRAALARDVSQNRPDDLAEETAGELLARYGLPADLRHRLVMGILEATIRSLDIAERRTLGLEPLVFSATPAPPAEPARPRLPSEQPKAPTKPLVSSLLEEHFARRLAMGNMLQQVIGQERTTLRHFMAICGDRPVDTYQRGDVTTFLDTLRKLPAVYGRSPSDKHKSLAEIIAEADAKGAERLTERTVKRHSSALAQFFRYAMDQGYIPNADRVGLVEDHRFAKGARSAKEQRDAWTSEELTALFRSPVWTGRHATRPSQPGPHIIKDAKYWLPLLALYHGARLEEFADMRRKDIGQEDAIWFARISDEERRLKTDNSRRIIPLHQEVLRLGFIQYVEEKAPSPDAPLFPDLEPQGPDGKRGPRFTRDFGHYRRAIGLYRPGVGMHAFRHTANTRLRDVIEGYQQERHVAYLLGHSQGGGEGRERYDKGPGLRAVAETLALLTYPDVSIP